MPNKRVTDALWIEFPCMNIFSRTITIARFQFKVLQRPQHEPVKICWKGDLLCKKFKTGRTRRSLQNVIYVSTTASRVGFFKAVQDAIYLKYKVSHKHLGDMPLRFKWEKGNIILKDVDF